MEKNNKMKLYLLKLGEISLKGLNRDFFEKKLKNNIKHKLKGYHTICKKQKGRMYFYIANECPEEKIEKALSTTFGVVGYSRSINCAKNWEAIVSVAKKLIEDAPFSSGIGNFKVETRRADKSFPMTSYEISGELGGIVLDRYPEMAVKVKNPEKVLFCEIRDQAYLYTSPKPGLGGLPTGTAGKGLLLLSGGIDSPVAGFRMAKRGLSQDCLYFHAYPYTSDQALQKVKDLAYLISPYLQGTRLYVINFTEIELWIKDNSNEEEHTLMMRAAMLKCANKVAEMAKAKAIVTGEALSQVASQTLDSLCFTNSMSKLPVLRPLIGMDKQEIVDTSVKIGTYETSILPYDDCCVIFSPKHPKVRPDVIEETEAYEKMNINDLVDKAVEAVEVFPFVE